MTQTPDRDPPLFPSSPLFEPLNTPDAPDAIALRRHNDGAIDAERWFRLGGKASVRNVATPTLTPFLPDPGKATGAAVVIAPGGGFLIGSMENEGWQQARWLADRGIAAFVLKYRLQPTAADDAAFGAALVERFRSAVVAPGEHRRIAVPAPCMEDGEAAMVVVRCRAADWQISPARVGWLGFSAGAMIGLGLDRAKADARPDFLGAVYPSMEARDVPPDAPPLFVAMAADDELFGRQGFGLAESWHEAGRPVELHVWQRGGHGYGMGKPGTTSTATLASFHAWLNCGGWLDDDVTGEN